MQIASACQKAFATLAWRDSDLSTPVPFLEAQLTALQTVFLGSTLSRAFPAELSHSFAR